MDVMIQGCGSPTPHGIRQQGHVIPAKGELIASGAGYLLQRCWGTLLTVLVRFLQQAGILDI